MTQAIKRKKAAVAGVTRVPGIYQPVKKDQIDEKIVRTTIRASDVIENHLQERDSVKDDRGNLEQENDSSHGEDSEKSDLDRKRNPSETDEKNVMNHLEKGTNHLT
jgi:hypothetical protein